MRILIIEDEKDLVKPLKKFLEDKGFAVDFAYDGKKGLYFAQVNNYDCILLDLNLPKLDGVDLAKQLRKESNTTPIIMVTARSQMYDKLNGFGVGADDYITKPFDLKELLARIKSVVKRNSVNKTETLKFANFELKPSQNKVLEYKDNKVVKEFELSNKEIGVLEY
ncbi:response regulator transcription factor, partial [Patescibacteria group bacterium]